MKIPVDRLTATPTPFDFEAGAGWWRSSTPARSDGPKFLDPLLVAVRAHTMGDDLFLEGSVEGELELECSRCLARYRHGLREPFRLVLEPAGSRRPADPEGAEALARDGLCLQEDIETGWFEGQQIDLAAFVFEVVALALPVKPLCREDCAGLCPRCGIDRNRGTCECSEMKTESPFAVLQALRERQSEGES